MADCRSVGRAWRSRACASLWHRTAGGSSWRRFSPLSARRSCQCAVASNDTENQHRVQDYQLRFDDVITPLPPAAPTYVAASRCRHHHFRRHRTERRYGQFFADASGQWSQNGHDHNQQVEGNAIGDGVFTAATARITTPK